LKILWWGKTFVSGRLRVTNEQIKALAAEFDPQPFHLDEVAAQNTFFKGLAASGWHTAALSRRLLVEGDVVDVKVVLESYDKAASRFFNAIFADPSGQSAGSIHAHDRSRNSLRPDF
jgi:acyl dehydratase